MGLPWVRLDTAFPRNPKLLALLAEKDGRGTAFVYLCGLAYSGEHGTDGYLPRFVLAHIHGRPKDAALLTSYQLWHERDSSGWDIHDWAQFQESTAETQHRKERALKANCRRWHDSDCNCWKNP